MRRDVFLSGFRSHALATAVPAVAVLFCLLVPSSAPAEPTDGVSETLSNGRFEKCPDSQESTPNLTCTVIVQDLEKDLFADLTGTGCEGVLHIPAGTRNFVIRYVIPEHLQSELRFTGSVPTCDKPVTESGTCDPTDNPFQGLECAQVRGERIVGCQDCVRPELAFCFRQPEEHQAELVVTNANECRADPPMLSYLISVKAKQPTTVEGRDYFRQYLVDPTVVQEPNCPHGCPPPPPPP